MIDPKKIVAVEYSISQNCFHVQTLEEVIGSNFRAVMDRRQSDWVLVGVVESHEIANELIDVLRTGFKIDDYSIYQNINGNLIVK